MGLLAMLGLKPKVNFKDIYDNGAIIIDFRTKEEFSQRSFLGSKNIPLNKLRDEVKGIKAKNKVIIAVCKSGGRSEMAIRLLKKHDIKVYNAVTLYYCLKF